jgi:hypothetical protein
MVKITRLWILLIALAGLSLPVSAADKQLRGYDDGPRR